MNLQRTINIIIGIAILVVEVLGVIALIINAKRALKKGDKRGFRYDTCIATALIFLAIITIWLGIQNFFL